MGETGTATDSEQERSKEDAGSGERLVGRLAGAGEDAFKRLSAELEKNDRAREALSRLAGARGHLERLSRSALHQLGVAPLEDVEALRRHVNKLEKRLRALERSSGTTPSSPAADASESQAGQD